MDDLIIGLKISSYTSIAACVKIIRRYREYSVSEIKERIENDQYLLCYNSPDRDGLKNIISCYEELRSNGIGAAVFDLDNRPTTIDILRNKYKRYEEISEELDAETEWEIE